MRNYVVTVRPWFHCQNRRETWQVWLSCYWHSTEAFKIASDLLAGLVRGGCNGWYEWYYDWINAVCISLLWPPNFKRHVCVLLWAAKVGKFSKTILNFSKCSMMPGGHHSDSSITTHSLTEYPKNNNYTTQCRVIVRIDRTIL